MGLGHTKQFQRYHRVLNRAAWSTREVSRVLLGLLRGSLQKADTVKVPRAFVERLTETVCYAA
jgi:hypothetical protein